MYYKGVNRGLAFTKPGVYVFGLVLLIGMIAVTTGINGLYVFLSAGLGGFIISGLLSEKAMKSAWVRGIAGARVDAQTPFTIAFTIENVSPWFAVFGLDVVFALKPPRFRLVSAPLDGIARGRLSRIPASGVYSYEISGPGLPRGLHREMFAVHQTIFPFGILEKFKMSRVPSSLIVAPSLKADLLDELRRLLRLALANLDAEKEFFNHRPYTLHDGLKDMDWRKSANRPPQEWVLKQYRSPAGSAPVCLEAPWQLAVNQQSEGTYEDFLSRVRTALKALEETERDYYVDWGNGALTFGYEECLAILAAAPIFTDRAKGLGVIGNTPGANRSLHLTMTGDGSGFAVARGARRTA